MKQGNLYNKTMSEYRSNRPSNCLCQSPLIYEKTEYNGRLFCIHKEEAKQDIYIYLWLQ